MPGEVDHVKRVPQQSLLQVVERSEPDVGGLLRRMVSTTASDRPSAIQLIKAFKQLRMPRLLSLFALAGSDVRCGRCRQSLQAVVLWSLRCFDRKARAAPQEAVQEAGVLRQIISCIHQTHD